MTTTSMQRQLPNVVALALFPMPCWHCHPCHAGIFHLSLLSLQWHHLDPHRAGLVIIVALALLPPLHWHPNPCHAGVVSIVALVLLPSIRWHHHRWHLCHCCTGVFTVVAVTPSTLLHWSLCCWSMDALADARCSGRGTMPSCWLWG
jgi:hypothetical protein